MALSNALPTPLQGLFWGKNVLKKGCRPCGSLQTQCLPLSFPYFTAAPGQVEHLLHLGATVPCPQHLPTPGRAKYEGSEGKMEERLKNEEEQPKNEYRKDQMIP